MCFSAASENEANPSTAPPTEPREIYLGRRHAVTWYPQQIQYGCHLIAGRPCCSAWYPHVSQEGHFEAISR